MNAPVYGKDYIDNPPLRAVTAEDVRAFRSEMQCRHGGCQWCVADLTRAFLPRLLEHPGVSSTARAVVEAMIEVMQ